MKLQLPGRSAECADGGSGGVSHTARGSQLKPDKHIHLSLPHPGRQAAEAGAALHTGGGCSCGQAAVGKLTGATATSTICRTMLDCDWRTNHHVCSLGPLEEDTHSPTPGRAACPEMSDLNEEEDQTSAQFQHVGRIPKAMLHTSSFMTFAWGYDTGGIPVALSMCNIPDTCLSDIAKVLLQS